MAKQKYTEAKKNSNLKWDTANLDRMSLALPKGSREAIKAHAAALGESTNAFIKRAIDCQMERDSGAGGPQRAAELAAVAGAVSIPPAALEAVQAAIRPAEAAQMAAAVASFSPQMLETVQIAAEAAGESLPEFVRRAVETQAQRDKAMRGLKR